MSSPHPAWIPLPTVAINTGRIILLREIPLLPLPTSLSSLPSPLSVRIIAHIIYYDASRSLAVIQQEEQQLSVDTTLIKDFHFQLNSLQQFIGELEYQNQTEKDNNNNNNDKNPIVSGWLLRARVFRCMSTLDMNLFERVLLLRREMQRKIGIDDITFN